MADDEDAVLCGKRGDGARLAQQSRCGCDGVGVEEAELAPLDTRKSVERTEARASERLTDWLATRPFAIVG